MTDPLHPHRASKSTAILRPLLVALVTGLVVLLIAARGMLVAVEVFAIGALIAASVAAFYLLTAARVAAASHVLIATLLCTGVIGVLGYGSIRGIANVCFIGAVVVAGTFLGRRALLVTVLLSAALTGALAYAEATGRIAAIARPVGFIIWLVFSISFVMIGLAVHYSRSVALEANERLQQELADRERADATIRLTEERLRLSMEAARQGWFDLDIPSGRVVTSEQFARLMGADPERPGMSVQTWMDNIHADDRPAVLAAFDECVASRDTRQMEYRLRARTGDWKWMRSIARVVEWDEQRRPLRMTGTHADISDQVRETEARRASDLRYRAMFELAVNAILQTSFDGKALAANPAFVRMFGYESEADVLATLVDLPRGLWANPEERATVAQRIRTQGFVHGYECEFLRKDGERIWISLNAAVGLGPDGRGNSFHSSIDDISVRKRAEAEAAALQAQLLQAQKMESVGRLAGGVAHDFNNMLGVIIGVAELSAQQLDAQHPLRADFQEIHDAARRSADLTRQLLTFARKQTVARRPLDLNETVARTNRMLTRLIGENVHLEWHPGDALWPVFMDATQLDQILTNLCVNAKDAITDFGTLRITTANCAIDASLAAKHADAAPGDHVRLTVSDTGCGMSAEVAAQIFEPFFTTKGVGEGTGLGLSSVYGAVRQNHGFITVSSILGHGTTFEIYLPRYVGPGEVAQQGADAAPARGPETILVVEDEPRLLQLTTRALERSGYKVLTAADPAAALALETAYAGTIDLLLSDVVMPQMNGRSLADAMRLRRPRIKWLFMSGFTTDVTGVNGMLDDAERFIGKPFSISALNAKVREVLDAG